MAKAFVLGMGKSGKAVSKLLLHKGFELFLHDDNPKICEKATLQDVVNCDFLVIAPGVNLQHPFVEYARELGIAVRGEVDVALDYIKQPCLGITGTNGKTTVTLMVEHVLNHCGIKAKAIGNVGYAASSYALDSKENEVLVLELSSYQIDTLNRPCLDAGVILNITPDHLDRYGNMSAYASSKLGIKRSLKEGAPLYVYEEVFKEFGKQLGDSAVSYSALQKEGTGLHDRENMQAAFLLTRPWEISEAEFFKALELFKKPKHRIEFIASIEGVSYYDDSKGTNIDAAIKAVQCMPSNVVLIAGGVDKGFPYTSWIPAFKGKVKKVVALGQASEKIFKDLQEAFDVEKVSSMEEAVVVASRHAASGESVLLSPGCSSYDMFQDYAERGREFQRCVLNLQNRGEF